MIRRAGEMQMNNGNVKSRGGRNYSMVYHVVGVFLRVEIYPVNHLHIFYSVECESSTCKCVYILYMCLFLHVNVSIHIGSI